MTHECATRHPSLYSTMTSNKCYPFGVDGPEPVRLENSVSHPPKFTAPGTANGYARYPMAPGLRVVVAGAIPLMICGCFANLYSKEGESWVSLLLIGTAAFCVYNMPPTILCSQDRVISLEWYGARKISIEWRDVISVWRNPENDSITITSNSGLVITYTRFNVGRREFLDQISKLPFQFARML